MKRFLICVAFAAQTLLFGAAGQQRDLMATLDDYLHSIEDLEYPDAMQEIDFMISSVERDSLRNVVAQRAYEYFRDSKVMGSENLAVYLYDAWFSKFRVVFDDYDKFAEAEFYSFLNRPSLIGVQAQPLVLTDLKGGEVALPASDGSTLSVLYFYSASCPKCLYISHRLKEMLSKKAMKRFKGADGRRKRIKLNFYAVYAGEDDAEWQEYLRSNLTFPTMRGTAVHHLKGGDSDFVTAYAVVQTPRLFLVGPDGRIAGRNLDDASLKILLQQ